MISSFSFACFFDGSEMTLDGDIETSRKFEHDFMNYKRNWILSA